MLRVGPFSELPAVLRCLGYDPEAVLREAGFSLSLFESFDAQIPFRSQCELIERCASAVGCAHLGLLVGARCQLRALGALGLLQKYSADVGGALRSLIRFQRYQVAGGEIAFHEAGDEVFLSYRIGDVSARDHLENIVVSAMCAVLRVFLGAAWNPSQAVFSSPAPRDAAPFHQFFGCPVAFSSSASGLVFRQSHLQRRLARHDPDLCDYLCRQLEQFAPVGEKIAEQVLKLLRTTIPSGAVRSEQIADLLNVHSRTLHRRLRDCGTNFQELLDYARYGLARRLLDETSMTVGKVAEALGYSEPSAFVRAFRRWSGASPKEWRNGDAPGTLAGGDER
ncbi:MAG: hypothetical protein H6R17_2106 [Proteobacteria bacterium]|nr:hypothetical protein [Pseudomonadota bacterium]